MAEAQCLIQPTYAALEAIQMKGTIQGSNKLASQWLSALFADPQLATGSTPVSLSRSIPLPALAGLRFVSPGSWESSRHAGARIGGLEVIGTIWRS